MVAAGDFLEHAAVFDNYYGTARRQVEESLAAGQDLILEIDWQGAADPRARCPSAAPSSSCRRRAPNSSGGCAARHGRRRRHPAPAAGCRRRHEALARVRLRGGQRRFERALDELQAIVAGRGEALTARRAASRARRTRCAELTRVLTTRASEDLAPAHAPHVRSPAPGATGTLIGFTVVSAWVTIAISLPFGRRIRVRPVAIEEPIGNADRRRPLPVDRARRSCSRARTASCCRRPSSSRRWARSRQRDQRAELQARSMLTRSPTGNVTYQPFLADQSTATGLGIVRGRARIERLPTRFAPTVVSTPRSAPVSLTA